MSIKNNKVKFDQKLRYGKGLVWLLGGIEIALTVILGFVVATTKVFSPSAESAPGVVNKLSYQGRLTDTSGNALGGTGTDYCFRFSIYDASSGGNKLWPAGTPATTTLSVVSGVFNAEVGSADTLTYDMYPTSTSYLNVDVYSISGTCTGGSWESLTPRQQILATGYSIAAENVYGDLLRTDVASSIVQIGTGAGVSSSSVKMLALDVANTVQVIGDTCSISGTIWYNSHASNTQLLFCENGKVRPLSVGYLKYYENYPGLPAAQQTVLVNQSTQYVAPFIVPQPLSASYLRIPVSVSAPSTSFATTANTTFSMSALNTYWAVVYSAGTGANSRSLQSVASGSTAMSVRQSLQANANGSQYTVSYQVTFPGNDGASSTYTTSVGVSNASFQISSNSYTLFTGMRFLNIPFATSLSAGNYWLALAHSSTTSTQGTAAFSAARISIVGSVGLSQPNNAINMLGNATNSSNQLQIGLGSWTTNAIGTTASIGLANVSSSASHNRVYFQLIRQE